MKRKQLIAIIVILGIALTIFNPAVMGMLAFATWIYMTMMIKKKNIRISYEQSESELVKRNLKWLKSCLILAAILFVVSITSLFLHNYLDDHSENQVSIFFYLTLGAMYLFVLTTGGGLFIFLKAREKNNRYL